MTIFLLSLLALTVWLLYVSVQDAHYWRTQWFALSATHARALDELENLMAARNTPAPEAHTGGPDHDAIGHGTVARLLHVPPEEAARVVPPRGTRFSRPTVAHEPVPGVQTGDRLGASGATARRGGPPDYRRYAGATVEETNRTVRPVLPPDDVG